MESGEPLHLHDDDGVASGEKSDAGAIPKHLAVPANLFFTGTVNVDETTYMFSPKVLDRAFTLELNVVDLEAYGAKRLAGDDGADGGLALRQAAHPFHTGRPPTSEDWEAFGALEQGRLREQRPRVNGILDEDNRHFGYRVANEIARFVSLADGQGPTTRATARPPSTSPCSTRCCPSSTAPSRSWRSSCAGSSSSRSPASRPPTAPAAP